MHIYYYNNIRYVCTEAAACHCQTSSLLFNTAHRAFQHRMAVRVVVCALFFEITKNDVEGALLLLLLAFFRPMEGNFIMCMNVCSMFVWNENVIMRKIASTADLNSQHNRTKQHRNEKYKKEKKNYITNTVRTAHSTQLHIIRKWEYIFNVSLCIFPFLLRSHFIFPI